MSLLVHRHDVVLKDVTGSVDAADSYTVIATRPGAIASAASSDTTIPVHRGHKFIAGDYLMVGTDETTFRNVTAVTDVQITVATSVSVSSGSIIVNLGNDGGTTTPDYLGSRMRCFSDPAGTNALSVAGTVSVAAGTGVYSYWWPGGEIWEIVLDNNGSPQRIITGIHVGDPGVLYAANFATGGSGTAASPWTGWEAVVQFAVDQLEARSSEYGVSRVHFSAGVYATTTSGVFSDITTTAAFLRGARFTGDGANASIVQFGTLSTATWFFDNDSGSGTEDTWGQAVFEGLGFRGQADTAAGLSYTDIDSNAKGFRVREDVGGTRNMCWRDCVVELLHTGFDFTGTNQSSEHRWYNTDILKIADHAVMIKNPQSINNAMFGCDLQNIFGDVLQLDGNAGAGGAGISLYGCNIIVNDGDIAVPADKYVVRFKNATSWDINTQPVLFSGCQVELRDNNAKLVGPGDVAEIQTFVVFQGCGFKTDSTTTSNVEIVEVHEFQTVVFDTCVFHEQGTGSIRFRMKGVDDGKEHSGEIQFLNCKFPKNTTDNEHWATRVQFDNAGIGRVIARGCWGATSNAIATAGQDGTTSAPKMVAHDFDVNFYEGTNVTQASTPLKIALLKRNDDNFPYYSGGQLAEQTVFLPPNAIIVGVYVRKDAGGSANTYQLQVTNDDDTFVYGQSTSANESVEHEVSLTYGSSLTTSGKLPKNVGTAEVDRIIRLKQNEANTGPHDGGQTGGYAYIEYI